MTTLMRTQAGYRATREGSALVVHGVPIFVECSRARRNPETGEPEVMEFGREWIDAAVAKAQQAALDGYHPPLHIRHHEPGSEVKAAGFFRITGTQQIRFKGETRVAIVADLVVTDPATQIDILERRLPYRSVEIFDVNKPAIDSLALLDHEAPFLELPMLLVQNPDVGVAGATFRWTPDATVSAIFRRGDHAHLLFQETKMADGDTEEKDKGEQMEAAPMDVGAICKAIKDGSISVADMKEIVAAIEAQMAEGDAEEPSAEEPAPAEAPSENMRASGELAVKMARLEGELSGTKAQLEAMKADAKRKDHVAAAMKRLDGRPLGADLEERLVAFHREHGEKAFDAYVDAMAKAVAPLPSDTSIPDYRGQGAPAVAMKYQDQGPDAVAKAAEACHEWETLKRHRATRLTQERYVELAMRAQSKES